MYFAGAVLQGPHPPPWRSRVRRPGEHRARPDRRSTVTPILPPDLDSSSTPLHQVMLPNVTLSAAAEGDRRHSVPVILAQTKWFAPLPGRVMCGVTSIHIMATRGPIVVRRRRSGNKTVLSIGRLGVASGADYYLESIANSVDDYYLGRGRPPDNGSEPHRRPLGCEAWWIPRPCATCSRAAVRLERISGSCAEATAGPAST